MASRAEGATDRQCTIRSHQQAFLGEPPNRILIGRVVSTEWIRGGIRNPERHVFVMVEGSPVASLEDSRADDRSGWLACAASVQERARLLLKDQEPWEQALPRSWDVEGSRSSSAVDTPLRISPPLWGRSGFCTGAWMATAAYNVSSAVEDMHSGRICHLPIPALNLGTPLSLVVTALGEQLEPLDVFNWVLPRD